MKLFCLFLLLFYYYFFVFYKKNQIFQKFNFALILTQELPNFVQLSYNRRIPSFLVI